MEKTTIAQATEKATSARNTDTSRVAFDKAAAQVQVPAARAAIYCNRLAAAVISHAAILAELAHDLMKESVAVREETVKQIRAWQRGLVKAAQDVKVQGIDVAQSKRIAASATTRASEFSKIVEASNAGMDAAYLVKMTKAKNAADVSFHVIVALARNYLKAQPKDEGTGSGGTGGRQRMPVMLKVWNYVHKLEGLDEKEQALIAEVEAKMLPILKRAGIDPNTHANSATKVEKTDDKAPGPVKVSKPAEPKASKKAPAAQ